MFKGIIYQITNKVNGKVYIGQTKHSLEKRKKEHMNAVRTGIKMSYIHKAIRRYGAGCFSWRVLYLCDDPLVLNLMETFKIMVNHSHVSEGGYNLTWGGEDNPMNSIEIRIRAKNSINKAMKKFTGNNNVMYNPIVKQQHKEAIDRVTKTAEWREAFYKANEKQKGEYVITTPTGECYYILGLSEFCRKNNLQQSKMSEVAAGRRNHHKGYKCQLVKHNKKGGHAKRIGTKLYHIIQPSGEVLDITNLTLFCKENGLSYNSMLSVLKGRQKYHKGYSFLY